MIHMIDMIWIHTLNLENTNNSVIEQVHISHLPIPFWQYKVKVFPAFLEQRQKNYLPWKKKEKIIRANGEKGKGIKQEMNCLDKDFHWAMVNQMGRSGLNIYKMNLNSKKSLIY